MMSSRWKRGLVSPSFEHSIIAILLHSILRYTHAKHYNFCFPPLVAPPSTWYALGIFWDKGEDMDGKMHLDLG